MPKNLKKRHQKANQKQGQLNITVNIEDDEQSNLKDQHDSQLAGLKYVTRNIDLHVQLPDGASPELVRDYPANFYDMDKQGGDLRLRLFDVVHFLKKQGYALESTYISYYSPVFSAYVNCNKDPLAKTIWLTQQDLAEGEEREVLRLRFQKGLCRFFTQDNEESEKGYQSEE